MEQNETTRFAGKALLLQQKWRNYEKNSSQCCNFQKIFLSLPQDYVLATLCFVYIIIEGNVSRFKLFTKVRPEEDLGNSLLPADVLRLLWRKDFPPPASRTCGRNHNAWFFSHSKYNSFIVLPPRQGIVGSSLRSVHWIPDGRNHASYGSDQRPSSVQQWQFLVHQW